MGVCLSVCFADWNDKKNLGFRTTDTDRLRSVHFMIKEFEWVGPCHVSIDVAVGPHVLTIVIVCLFFGTSVVQVTYNSLGSAFAVDKMMTRGEFAAFRALPPDQREVFMQWVSQFPEWRFRVALRAFPPVDAEAGGLVMMKLLARRLSVVPFRPLRQKEVRFFFVRRGRGQV